jgi:uncharacterized DUF497 family protein
VKHFAWDAEKNELLKSERGISFEEVVFQIENGGLIAVIAHPNQLNYAHQKVFLVEIEKYVYVVPFVESDDEIFLKTAMPSRKMTRRYIRNEEDQAG